MFAKKLFQNKKAQYARAMRRYWASQERTYRQLKAKQLYNQGIDIDRISYELGVGIDTTNKYLRETEHLTDKEVASELSAVESQIQSQENFARFMLGFIKYFFYLLFYFLFLPSIFEAFESSINWYIFFWKNWWIGVIAVPLIFYLIRLYKRGAFKKSIPDTEDNTTKINELENRYHSEDLSTLKGRNNVILKLENFVKLYKDGSLKKLNLPMVEYHTKINGLRYRCSSNYLNTLKEGDKVILELDRTNKYDKNAVKVINKKDNKHLGFIPKSFNKTEKIFQKLQDGKIIDCVIEEVYKNPKNWLNSHTIRIKINYEE